MAWILPAIAAGSSIFGSLVDSDSSDRAARDQERGLQNAAQGITDATQQGIGYLNPFRQAGEGALPEYKKELASFSNPFGFLKDVQSQFEESPSQAAAKKAGLDAIRNSAEARGLAGSGAEAKGLEQFGINTAGNEFQQYLGNVLGLKQGELGGLGKLIGAGQTAATQSGLEGISGATKIGDILSSIGGVQGLNDSTQGGILSGLLGQIGGGAAGASGAFGGEGGISGFLHGFL